MTFFKEGDNPQPGTPNAKCYAFTFGVRLATGKVTPCTTDGQKAEFVFNDTVAATENGFGVGLLSKTHSGGIGVPVLAGGAIAQGDEICVKMVNFTIDGATVSLPVAISIDDADDGDWIVGKASLGSSASEADTDANAPSIALEFYDIAYQVVGGEQAPSIMTIPITLAQLANGDIVTSFTPGFAGEIVSIAATVTVPATTAAKAATLNLEINSTNVTGGVLALTSANMTPLGNTVAGTAITAANTFDADDTISVEASGVTAFVEGSAVLLITLKANDTPAA